MKVLENGIYRELTPEEIAINEFEQEPFQEPTFEERLAALEAAMLEQLLGG
jgi:hypothetical protein